jgi:hypothetical protein
MTGKPVSGELPAIRKLSTSPATLNGRSSYFKRRYPARLAPFPCLRLEFPGMLHDDLDVRLGHRLPQIPVHDLATANKHK